MSQREVILAFLASANGPICDDCLSDRTGITPRQTININCRSLADSNAIRRLTGERCAYCRRTRICNSTPSKLIAPMDAPADIAPQPQSQTAAVQRAHPHALWHWEGNIQSAVVTHLAAQRWSIRSVADTAAKTAGKDIIARRNNRTLWVSVKGYPNPGNRSPNTQARHWFAHAMFDMVVYRDESTSAKLAVALPDGFQTYQNLASRVLWLRRNLPFAVYWVKETGEVRRESAGDGENLRDDEA